MELGEIEKMGDIQLNHLKVDTLLYVRDREH